MSSLPEPGELRDLWSEDEGAYRDIYVSRTTVNEWQRVVAAVTARWPFAYTEDTEPAKMPVDVGAIFVRRAQRSTRLRVHLRDHLTVDAHFFEPEQVEFTFAPKEVLDEADVYRVLDFVLLVGRSLGRTVHMTTESFGRERPSDDLRYDAKLDRLVRPPVT